MDVRGFLAENGVLVENKLKALFLTFRGPSPALKDAMEYSLFSEGKRDQTRARHRLLRGNGGRKGRGSALRCRH